MQLKDICLYRESGDSLQINQIFGTTRKIIFFFSELGCASCYMPFLENAIGRQDALKEKDDNKRGMSGNCLRLGVSAFPLIP